MAERDYLMDQDAKPGSGALPPPLNGMTSPSPSPSPTPSDDPGWPATEYNYESDDGESDLMLAQAHENSKAKRKKYRKIANKLKSKDPEDLQALDDELAVATDAVNVNAHGALKAAGAAADAVAIAKQGISDCVDLMGTLSGVDWSDGKNGCVEYINGDDWCNKFGRKDYNGEGKAMDKCCVCGGGQADSPPPPPPPQSETSSFACSSCELVPCGECQHGCPTSLCSANGATSRNGCVNNNDGRSPTSCDGWTPVELKQLREQQSADWN